MSRCEWIPLAERARWLAALDGIEHGCTHRPEYSAAAACVTGHEAGLWHWQDEHGRAACPIGRRAAPGGGFDLVTPLGFGGFAIAGQVADLPADWTRFWQAQGALAAYVQLSPWLEPEKWRAVLAGFDADLHASRECWLWDLRPAPESLGAGLHLNHQRSLRTWQSSASPCWDPGELRPAFERLYADFVLRRDPAMPTASRRRPSKNSPRPRAFYGWAPATAQAASRRWPSSFIRGATRTCSWWRRRRRVASTRGACTGWRRSGFVSQAWNGSTWAAASPMATRWRSSSGASGLCRAPRSPFGRCWMPTGSSVRAPRQARTRPVAAGFRRGRPVEGRFQAGAQTSTCLVDDALKAERCRSP